MTVNNQINAPFPLTEAQGGTGQTSLLSAGILGGIAIQRFPAGAFTYTPNAKMLAVIIEMVGAGAGSGGTTGAAGQSAASTGGGGGAYFKILATAAQIGASASGSIGTGGLAGTSGNNAGGNGGNSTITINGGTPWVAGGATGGGGQASTAAVKRSSASGGSGGVHTNGTNATLLASEDGEGASIGNTGAANSLTGAIISTGGASILGISNFIQATAGSPGTAYGSGASGSMNVSGANSAGSAGADGIGIFYEFLSA